MASERNPYTTNHNFSKLRINSLRIRTATKHPGRIEDAANYRSRTRHRNPISLRGRAFRSNLLDFFRRQLLQFLKLSLDLFQNRLLLRRQIDRHNRLHNSRTYFLSHRN